MRFFFFFLQMRSITVTDSWSTLSDKCVRTMWLAMQVCQSGRSCRELRCQFICLVFMHSRHYVTSFPGITQKWKLVAGMRYSWGYFALYKILSFQVCLFKLWWLLHYAPSTTSGERQQFVIFSSITWKRLGGGGRGKKRPKKTKARESVCGVVWECLRVFAGGGVQRSRRNWWVEQCAENSP